MYYITAKADFDSAHFLAGYQGKCRHIHGHRWSIVGKFAGETLQSQGEQAGMLLDFSDVKKALRDLADSLDHCLLIEAGSLRPGTMAALREEGFLVQELPFRPTAENLAKHLFVEMKHRGFPICGMTVYETPDNCASYEENPL